MACLFGIPLILVPVLLVGCGGSASEGDLDQSAAAVVGGTPIDQATYPATGALIDWRSGTPQVVCTATLIAPRVLLTAAHCVSETRALAFTTIATIDRIMTSTTVQVRRSFVHPAFDPRAIESMHDIALVELDSALDGVLPDQMLDLVDGGTVLRAGLNVDLVGYGLMSLDGGRAMTKNLGQAQVVGLTVSEISIGGPGQVQNCIGDSGGPSYWKMPDGERRIAGVVSRSADNTSDCINGSIHTRVDVHRMWIGGTLDVIANGSPHRAPSCAATGVTGGCDPDCPWWSVALGLAIVVRNARNSKCGAAEGR